MSANAKERRDLAVGLLIFFVCAVLLFWLGAWIVGIAVGVYQDGLTCGGTAS